MTAESLEAEVERLRAEVATYRQRELAELRSALAAARQEAEHYRIEAHRNADVGRQIAAQSQQQISELRTKLELVTKLETSSRRPQLNGRA